MGSRAEEVDVGDESGLRVGRIDLVIGWGERQKNQGVEDSEA